MIQDNGGPAFPANNEANVNGTMGMTLRDHFAGLAMQAALTTATGITEENAPLALPVVAKLSYAMADAMLAARKREKSE